MSGTKLFTLGPPRLEREGIPLEVRYRKNLALIVYLAVTGQRHSREALITLLWPEVEPSRARANLRRNLSVLRKALDGQFLVVDRETVGLDRGAHSLTGGQTLWVDVDQFRRLLSAWKGYGYEEADLCSECLDNLAQAVELYQGDFLSGFGLGDSLAFDEWQFFQAEELRRELASVLERLVRGHGAEGKYELAISYARRWLALDPLHEPVHQHLMQLYVRAGQRSAALRQYEECARILEAELRISPSRETRSLYERIRAQPAEREEPLFPTALPQHNLPVQTTPFIGREAVLAEIAERLQDPDCRLLSLVGPGGIGKTRLALEAAREQVSRFEDGVYWIALAPVSSIDTMLSTVAQTIGLSFFGATDLWQRLFDHLRQKRMLLLFDNVEHVLDPPDRAGYGAVDLVNGALQAAPDVKIVITSRERPNLQSECLLPISGLDYPKPTSWATRGVLAETVPSTPGDARQPEEPSRGEGVTRYAAIQLFLATARRVSPRFEPTSEELADIAQICQLVQGMPLAILLAAAWMEVLSPAEILAELERGDDLLEADLRDLPDRQRSIEAVFDASWRMLDDAERGAFVQLSVFRGGFTREAAESVAGAGLRMLASLVHKSFLYRDATGRYEVHELLRRYAEQKLAEDPEGKERASELHCKYYGDVLGGGLAGFGEGGGMWQLLIEMDNMRAGWGWAVSQGRFAEISRYIDLFGVHLWQGLYQEAISALEWAADVVRAHCADGAGREGSVALGLILIRLGRMYRMLDPGQRVELRDKLVEEGVSILRRLGARQELSGSAPLVAWTYGLEREIEARQVLQESLAFYRELGDLQGFSGLLPVLGQLAVRRGAYDEAERHCQEAIRLGKEFGNPSAINAASNCLARIAYCRGKYQRARQLYEEGLAHAEKRGQKYHVGMLCSALGDTALAMGDYEGARELHERAQALFQEMTVHWAEVASGQHYGVGYSLDRLGDIALAMGEIAQAKRCYQQALQIAWEHPQVALSLDVLVSQAALLAEGRHGERAVELSTLALHHPRSHLEVAKRAQQLLNQLEAELPLDVFAAAQERGRALELEATVVELLERRIVG